MHHNSAYHEYYPSNVAMGCIVSVHWSPSYDRWQATMSLTKATTDFPFRRLRNLCSGSYQKGIRINKETSSYIIVLQPGKSTSLSKSIYDKHCAYTQCFACCTLERNTGWLNEIRALNPLLWRCLTAIAFYVHFCIQPPKWQVLGGKHLRWLFR